MPLPRPRLLPVALATLATCLAVPTHAAMTVYEQGPASTAYGDTSAVWNNPADPGFTFSLDGDQQAWAYFHTPGAISFNRIAWTGSNADGVFGVSFIAASCFSCNASWIGTDGDSAHNLLPQNQGYSQAQVHKTSRGSGLYDYYIDLPAPLTLDPASSMYALSVVNNYTAQPFQWAASQSSHYGTHLSFYVGLAKFLRAPGDLSFSLIDTAAAPVPEPASHALWAAGLGLLGVLLGRRRRGT